MFDKKRTAGQLYGVLGHLMGDVDEIAEADYKQYLAGIQPGEVVRPRGKLTTEEGRKRLLARASRSYARIAELCDEAEREMGEEMAQAPSAEAISYLESLRGRAHVTRAEMEAAYRKYGDNWSVYRSLKEIELRQIGKGDKVACPQFSNTLEGGQEFLDAARKVAESFVHDVASESFKDETSRKSKASWALMRMNGYAEGKFGPEVLADAGRLAGEGEGA